MSPTDRCKVLEAPFGAHASKEMATSNLSSSRCSLNPLGNIGSLPKGDRNVRGLGFRGLGFGARLLQGSVNPGLRFQFAILVRVTRVPMIEKQVKWKQGVYGGLYG